MNSINDTPKLLHPQTLPLRSTRHSVTPNTQNEQEGTKVRHRPSLVSWNLTKKCNLQCPHCYMDAGAPAERELTTEECLAVIDEMKALGTEMVIQTGVEAYARRQSTYRITSETMTEALTGMNRPPAAEKMKSMFGSGPPDSVTSSSES